MRTNQVNHNNAVITPEILHHTAQLKALHEWVHRHDNKYFDGEHYEEVLPALNKIYNGILSAIEGMSQIIGFEFEQNVFWSKPEKSTAV